MLFKIEILEMNVNRGFHKLKLVLDWIEHVDRDKTIYSNLLSTKCTPVELYEQLKM